MKNKNTLYLAVFFFALQIGLPGQAFAKQNFLRFQATNIDDGVGGLTAVTIGPDNNLYFQEQDGDIFRHQISQATGLPTGERELLFQSNDAAALGLEFSPNATPDNLDVFVSYAENFADDTNGPDIIVPGNASVGRLTLPSVGDTGLATRTDVITGLTIGSGAHSTNQLRFGPDGLLYFNQGSVTGNGSMETGLSATTLVADVLNPNFVPVEVSDASGYDPNAPNAPVQIFATGVRNAYDLVFHSNGNLYTGINGNDGPGTTPDDPSTPANESVQARPDETLVLLIEGGFYGHPNPVRGEFIPFGGNPTSGNDPFQVGNLPVGTLPNVNFNPDLNFNLIQSTNFGSVSPNGIDEYTAVTGLEERLLVAFFGGQGTIQTLELDADGLPTGIEPLQDEDGNTLTLNNPLDLVVGDSGRIYVGLRPGLNSGDLFLLTPVVTPFVLGDANLDGIVNILDISAFIAILTSGEFQSQSDINGSGVVNILDITPFIQILSGQ